MADAPALRVACRRLRTKAANAPQILSGPSLAAVAGSTVNAYWCLGTMEPFGPDDGYAHPDVCTAARACFRPPRPEDGEEA